MESRTFLKKSLSLFLCLLMLSAVLFTGCAKQDTTVYSGTDKWVYLEDTVEGKTADVFFVCPTVYYGESGRENMSLDDEETKSNFLGATNMEKGIYDGNCRFFAPYYRQAGVCVYEMESAEEQEKYLSIAYTDVKAAFEYYLKHYNNGRPIVLAGFSQGADMCIRLIKDVFDDEKTSDLLVACYAIGWRFTEQETAEYPQLKAATGESDLGVVIAFNSEAESITTSLMVPAGVKTLSINPLNWKTDGTVADKSLNQGACFTDYEGNIKTEVPELTGAYIDGVRGTLKVTDVTAEEYKPILTTIFESGIYHLYDYQFFYRNLQENVKCRVNAFAAK
jgi:hypothetical protein